MLPRFIHPRRRAGFYLSNCRQLNDLEAMVGSINREIQTKYFHYKAGFVDYWKGF